MDSYIGSWEGFWSTFLVPDVPYDESPIRATISKDGDVYLIDYAGSVAGDDVTGRIRWSEDGGTITVDWVDSWHTENRHERLTGVDGAPPSYQYNGDDPWTWDITIHTSGSGVTVTHHNEGPGAGVPRYLGVEMRLENRTP